MNIEVLADADAVAIIAAEAHAALAGRGGLCRQDAGIHDRFSAVQGVEDDDTNVICMGGPYSGAGCGPGYRPGVFGGQKFSHADRRLRRLAKVASLEAGKKSSNG